MKKKMKPIFKGNSFVLVLVTIQFIGSLILGNTIGAKMTTGQLLVFSQVAFLLVPTAIYFIITKKPIKETLKLNKLYITDIICLIAIGILCYPIAGLCANISSIFFENNVQAVVNQLQGISFATLIGIMALTPAICEEIVMRGVVLSEYKYKNTFKAAVMNGIIFGLMHLSGQQFLYAAVLGFLFAYIVRITGSLFSTMIVHFVFNGFNMTVSYMATKFQGDAMVEAVPMTANTFLSAIITLSIMSTISGFIIWLLVRYMKKKRERLNLNIVSQDENEEENFSDEVWELKKETMVNLPFILLVIFNIVFIKLFQ
ncbi:MULTISPECIES: CPBP family intramembrane glutamic endopeptidase [Clostridium]|uniref:CPBP family intramembrane glutamic endopeptidase n=1 Tax=Clostridium TaxID=1485 RepID=UPI00068784DD|nr:type II CAAX endopeptidase family protein [Clostridium cadaveris]MDY4948795.1 type II CAAX endopeptidase family protein [Clostridium cadaveris]MDY5099267.1 type II CAAX endopeptidase family protein [Clostridium sp.]NWK11908.1 CPBP family intramembrane metalloprotease [Clostridium cadaveris]UFH65382.1 CPBP family intramembrane metalloprotease [Clostridium cadaveris]